MKPEFNQNPDLNIHVFKPRLTQPEEVDQILMSMAVQDLATGPQLQMVHNWWTLNKMPMSSTVNAIKYAAVGVKTVLIAPALPNFQWPEHRFCRTRSVRPILLANPDHENNSS